MTDDAEIPGHVKTQGVAEGQIICQFACDHDCTLVGHVHEAVRFLNQCLEHGIVESAVEEDPKYGRMIAEIAYLQALLLKRFKG